MADVIYSWNIGTWAQVKKALQRVKKFRKDGYDLLVTELDAKTTDAFYARLAGQHDNSLTIFRKELENFPARERKIFSDTSLTDKLIGPIKSGSEEPLYLVELTGPSKNTKGVTPEALNHNLTCEGKDMTQSNNNVPEWIVITTDKIGHQTITQPITRATVDKMLESPLKGVMYQVARITETFDHRFDTRDLYTMQLRELARHVTAFAAAQRPDSNSIEELENLFATIANFQTIANKAIDENIIKNKPFGHGRGL